MTDSPRLYGTGAGDGLTARVERARRRAALYRQAADRLVRRGRAADLRRPGRLDERPVFIVGSPRSGTTFLGRSLGSLPGFVDLGELPPFKAQIGDLLELDEDARAARIRRTLDLARRVGLVASLRAIEQTPEGAFVVGAIMRAYPEARVIHALRDGRDVAASLRRLGWLSAETDATDDVGAAYGSAPRPWVEPERRAEFASASDIRRAAWAWRRYVSAARVPGPRMLEVRYEQLVSQPTEVAEEIAAFLAIPALPLARSLGSARRDSVGRHARDLSDDELAEVLDEAGDLLRELGYT